MPAVFADAGYWIALVNPRDMLHDRAAEYAGRLDRSRTVTVLVEVLNGFSESGTRLRTKAAELAQAVVDDPNTDVVPQSPKLFWEALTLYSERPDKSWSLTDCASFVIMDQRRITEALTHDRHFEQNGYRALLRD